MTSSVTRQVVEGFLGDRLGIWLAHDVTFLDVTDPPVRTGRAAAALAFDRLFGGAFADVRTADLHVIAIGDHAAAEWTFEGCHVGALLGEPPTGSLVSLPMASTFEVHEGEIVRLHLFYDAAELQRQLVPTAPEAGNSSGTAPVYP